MTLDSGSPSSSALHKLPKLRTATPFSPSLLAKAQFLALVQFRGLVIWRCLIASVLVASGE